MSEGGFICIYSRSPLVELWLEVRLLSDQRQY